jgi:hypothetical protein
MVSRVALYRWQLATKPRTGGFCAVNERVSAGGPPSDGSSLPAPRGLAKDPAVGFAGCPVAIRWAVVPYGAAALVGATPGSSGYAKEGQR